jgi:outer membrane protein assembly factor BamB
MQSPADAGDWPSFRGDIQLTGATADTLPDEPKLLWTAEAPDGVAATAAIVGDRVYTAGLSGELHCRDLKTGDVRWTYRTEEVAKFRPGFLSSPAVAGGRVYLGDEDGFLHAVDAATGEGLWTFETGAEIISSPTVAAVPGGDGADEPVALFGSYDAKLYCLNAVTGELRWELETDGRVHCTPSVADGPVGARTFIAGCDEHLRGAQIADGAVTLDVPIGTYLIASPAAAGGRVYFGTYAGDERIRYRVFSGCAGWGPGQLEQELDRADWKIVDADAVLDGPADPVFGPDPYAAWETVDRLAARPPLDGLGGDFRMN